MPAQRERLPTALRVRRGRGDPLGRDETIGDRLNRPLSRNETVRPRDRAQSRTLRDRPLNRKTLNDRLAPPTIPQRAADHPEQPIERNKQNGEADPENGDARVDDEPLHHEADRTRASMTTMRKPARGPHTTRVVEQDKKRDAVAETHFKSNFSSWVSRYVVSLCHTVSHHVNTILLQCAPNLFNLPLIHTTNTNSTVDLAVTVLKNFELKRDTIQTENDVPAR